ncbi:MAG: hypothetical protein N4A63_07310 [Vallitalea sp.]|jgi:hypothetical protein|nr:hypothetical protein [Vallitalea sp.]
MKKSYIVVALLLLINFCTVVSASNIGIEKIVKNITVIYIDNGVQAHNILLSTEIPCRHSGSLEGVITSDNDIDIIKWAFMDMNNNLIVLEKCNLTDTKSINLHNYKDEIDFSSLGIGKYKFKLYIKSNKKTHKIIDNTIVIKEREDIDTKNTDTENINIKDIAILNMKYINISQGIGGENGHKGTYAIDLVGLSGNSETLYAPFDGTIKKIYSINNQQNFVWLESDKKIKYADGSYDYITVMTGHDSNISDLYIGKKIKQGDNYFQEGNSGKSTGNHIHLEVGKGKVTKKGWIKNKYGRWEVENHIRPDDVFYISNKSTIIDVMDLCFRKTYEGNSMR